MLLAAPANDRTRIDRHVEEKPRPEIIPPAQVTSAGSGASPSGVGGLAARRAVLLVAVDRSRDGAAVGGGGEPLVVKGRVEMEMKMGLRRGRKSAVVWVMVVGICR